MTLLRWHITESVWFLLGVCSTADSFRWGRGTLWFQNTRCQMCINLIQTPLHVRLFINWKLVYKHLLIYKEQLYQIESNSYYQIVTTLLQYHVMTRFQKVFIISIWKTYKNDILPAGRKKDVFIFRQKQNKNMAPTCREFSIKFKKILDFEKRTFFF